MMDCDATTGVVVNASGSALRGQQRLAKLAHYNQARCTIRAFDLLVGTRWRGCLWVDLWPANAAERIPRSTKQGVELTTAHTHHFVNR